MRCQVIDSSRERNMIEPPGTKTTADLRLLRSQTIDPAMLRDTIPKQAALGS